MNDFCEACCYGDVAQAQLSNVNEVVSCVLYATFKSCTLGNGLNRVSRSWSFWFNERSNTCGHYIVPVGEAAGFLSSHRAIVSPLKTVSTYFNVGIW